MEALVSIITPTFNSAPYLRETYQSLQNQTYPHWEWLVIDDASRDNSVEVLQELQQSDSRIKLFPQSKNQGPAISRNIGIENASGDFMTFIDADDIWFPDFIENSIQTIQTTGYPFVFSSYRRSDEQLNFVYSDFIVPKQVTYTDILKTNSISCLTAFLDIKALGKKYMPLIHKRQDMGLWLQYLKEIPFAYGIQEPKAVYRIRQNSLSRKKSDLIHYQWKFYREVEKLGVISSGYYMIHWMVRGFLKYRN
ncbi:MAG: glycosyltransferase family 2 protein [Flavobacterium sp.]